MKSAQSAVLFLCVFTSGVAARLAAPDAEPFSMEDYARVAKVDVHVHLKTEDPAFVARAARDRFRIVNIAVHDNDRAEMEHRHRSAFAQRDAHPGRVAVASSFPMAGWDEPEWQARTTAYLDRTFARGAVAVKVWKNIGMEFRDEDGELVMIDHPRFDPIFAHLGKRDVTLIGHLGEPKNCWLPLEEMTVKNDRSYFESHPEYHMHRHRDMPSYEDQLRARDRMLEKNRDLRFVGAHLGSLEWSVDELARFLDRFPRAAVDTAARIGHLQYQSVRDREKVRKFLIAYQDRILYGTDLTLARGADAEAFYERAHRRWLADWKYLATAETQTVAVLDDPVPGLALPRAVVEKIYRKNAERLFPRGWDRAETGAAGTP